MSCTYQVTPMRRLAGRVTDLMPPAPVDNCCPIVTLKHCSRVPVLKATCASPHDARQATTSATTVGVMLDMHSCIRRMVTRRSRETLRLVWLPVCDCPHCLSDLCQSESTDTCRTELSTGVHAFTSMGQWFHNGGSVRLQGHHGVSSSCECIYLVPMH